MADVKKIAGYDIKDATARDELSRIGDVVTGSELSFSCAVAANANVGSITLGVGTWVVMFSCGLPKPTSASASASNKRCRKGYFQLNGCRSGWDTNSGDANACFAAQVSTTIECSSATTLKAEFINFGDATCTAVDYFVFTAVRIK